MFLTVEAASTHRFHQLTKIDCLTTTLASAPAVMTPIPPPAPWRIPIGSTAPGPQSRDRDSRIRQGGTPRPCRRLAFVLSIQRSAGGMRSSTRAAVALLTVGALLFIGSPAHAQGVWTRVSTPN